MNRNILTLAFAGLMTAGIISCKKEEEGSASITTTTSSTATTASTGTTSGTSMPDPTLISRKCTGTGNITIDDVTDTMNVRERIIADINKLNFAINARGSKSNLIIYTGDTKLPEVNTTYTVLGDPNKEPATSEVILELYDTDTGKDFYATRGIITYTITPVDKVVQFTNLEFVSGDGANPRTISFNVSLK
jgi:hypothetical protein